MFNNKTKTFLLLTLIFVTLLGISAATAADINNNATDTPSISQDTTTQSEDSVCDNSIITTDVSNKNTQITKQTVKQDEKSDGEANFDDLYNDLQGSSEITLNKDYKHVDGDHGFISINENKIINGAGHTINSGNINLFTVNTTSTLTLKNLKINSEGTLSSNVIKVNGNLICDNVTFDMENITSTSNAIIRHDTNFANSTITNCTFENIAGTVGAIDAYRFGHLEVDDCTFKNITSKNGAIRIYNGNADYMPKYIVKNSRFVDCIDSNYGGAIYVYNTNTHLYVDNCYFENCKAGKGAAITAPSKNLTITNSQFINNEVNGSAVDSKGTITTTNNFAVIYTSGNTMNDPGIAGAEIYIQQGKINSPVIKGEDITANANEEITINYTITDDNGNSVLLKDVTYSFTVNGETYSADYNNGFILKTITAPSTDGTYPIEISLSDNGKIDGEASITNAVLTVGNPTPSGDVITDQTYSEFFNDDGSIKEGAISEGATAKFDGTFTNRKFNINIPMTVDTGNNQAVFDGCSITINNEVNIKNIKTTNTTVVVSSDKTLNIIDSSFANKSGNTRVFDVEGGATVNAEGSDFTNLGDWGAFYFASSSNANFKNCVFTNCSNTGSRQEGGAIEIRGSGIFTIDNCNFMNNTATLRGGAIYSKGNLTISNSTFTGNKVTTEIINKNQGGAVLYVEGDLYLYNNTMTDNTALTADIYNSYATIRTPVIITINDAECEERGTVDLTATVTDADGNTIDLIAESTGISGLDDAEYLLNLNLTVEDNKYNVTRNQSLKGQITRTIAPELAIGNYTISAEINPEELPEATITTGTLHIIEVPATTYTKLQKMIDETTEDTITIEKEVVRSATETVVVLNKSVTIDLDGLTWDANQGQAIEVVDGVTATIKNGIIFNIGNDEPSTSNVHGRLAKITKGNLVLENITITNCSAPDYGYTRGSLIRINSATSSLTVNNCTIENITGRFVIDNGRGTLDINNSKFINNDLGSIDSLIEIMGKTTINNSQFDNNAANWGVIYGNNQKDLLTLNNDVFSNNKITVGAPVVTKADAMVTNSKFLDNKAIRMTGKSGAIYTNGGSLTVNGSIFIGNTANDNDGSIIHHSGYIPGDLIVTNSVLIPADSKAAIYNEAEDTISAVANYNYWGTNSTPSSYVKSGTYEDEWYDEYDCTPIEVKYWVIMNTSISPEEFSVDDEVVIETSYNKYTDGAEFYDLEGTIPEMNITFTATEGTVDPENVLTENGVATATYRVTADSFTITATDSFVTNVIEATAIPTEPVVITLNDGNWTEYFNDDGTTKRIVTPGSELRFEGVFNNREMVITIPLNITTAETQAVLNNCTLVVGANDVNITDIQMNSNDVEGSLIYVEDAENTRIENNDLTLINNGEKVITNTIDITDSESIIIRGNNITTVGPEEDIIYDNLGQFKQIYTASINIETSNAVTIENNTVSTKGNGKITDVGTIYGINVIGKYIYDDEQYIEFTKITDNTVHTEAAQYAYGINVGHATTGLVTGNDVISVGGNYADAIQGYNVYDFEFTDNTVNVISDNMAYGIIAEGFFYMDDDYNMDWPTVEDNVIANNEITLKGKDAWAVEIVIGTKNTVEYNNITIVASNGVGVGIGDCDATIIENNNIDITATQESGINNGDAVDSYTTGVKITPSNSRIKSPHENNVTSNNITIIATNDDVSAVNVTSDDNIISDNYLLSPAGRGDKAVADTGEDNTIENNIPDYRLTDDTYSFYFDENGILKEEYNNTEIPIYGDFTENTQFIFEGVNVTIKADEFATLHDSQIITGSGATVVLDGITIMNKDMDAIYFESNGNVIKNSIIFVNSSMPLHLIEFAGDENTIANTIIIAYIPTADVVYDKDYVGLPQSSALYISSNNNLLDNVTVSVDGTSVAEGSYYPSIDAIDFQSTGKGVVIENNTITNSKVIATGSNYVYGINVGRAKDTTIENVNIDVESDYYTNGIQLFDAVDITIDGTIDSTADTQAYGVYATAMAVGTSSGIDLTGLNITVEAPDATGVLIEGASDVIIADATYDINGGSTTAVNAHVDWMGNIPKNINITGMDINIDGTEDNSILYFGLCDGVTITDCNIETTSGSEINFNKTSNAQVTDNYILIKDMISGSFGNYAVITTEDDTIIENNTPTSKLMEDLEQQLEDLQNELDQLKAPKATTLTLDPITDAKYNTNITISGSLVNEDSIGLFNQVITLTIGDKTVNVTTKGGEFTYTTSLKTLEEQTITASYAGNDKYQASEDTITFTLEKGDVIVTVDAISDVAYGGNVTITGKFTTSDGKAISNSNVKIMIDGKKYYAKTDKTGTYTLSVKASTLGENTITAGYSGNTNYNAYETTATFNVVAADAIVTYEPISDVTLGENVTISGTFTDANGKAVTNSNVKITINGKKYYAKTDSTGKYTLSVATTKEGVNNVTIGYSGSAKYNAFETSTTFTVLKAQ